MCGRAVLTTLLCLAACTPLSVFADDSPRAMGLRQTSVFRPVDEKAPAGNAGMFVGVNEFAQDPDIPPLRFAVHDAIEQAHLFVVRLNLIPPQNCYLMLSGTPRKAAVKQHLEDLGRAGAVVSDASKPNVLRTFLKVQKIAQDPTNLLVVGISSHGFDDGTVPYIMPADGLRQFLGDTAIRLRTIEDHLRASKAGHQLLLVDACQEKVSVAGTRAIEGGPSIPMGSPFIEALKKPTGQAKFASCNVGEFSYEHAHLRDVGHGVFTAALLDALEGGAAADAQGLIRMKSVSDYVNSSVTRWIDEQNQNRAEGQPAKKQSPSWFGPKSAEELALAIKVGDLESLIANLMKQNLPNGFEPSLRDQLVKRLKVYDSQKEADRDLLSSTQDFMDGKLNARQFLPILKDALSVQTPAAPNRIENSLGMRLQLIQSSKPRNQSPVPKSFYLGVYEVTQADWKQVIRNTPSWFSSTGEGKDKVANQDTSTFPVENVTWYDTIEFCNALSVLERLPAYYTLNDVQREDGHIKRANVAVVGGNGYRLPTVAEWEYAAEIGTPDPPPALSVVAWHQENADYYPRRVGTLRPNLLGLFDLQGNVTEWCEDDHVANPPNQKAAPLLKALKGGSWLDGPDRCEVARRGGSPPNRRLNVYGFRVAQGL